MNFKILSRFLKKKKKKKQQNKAGYKRYQYVCSLILFSVKKFFEVDGKTVEVKKAESRQAVKSK